MNSMSHRLPPPQFVAIDGVPIATYVLSPPEYTTRAAAPAPMSDVVFCHGTPWSSRVWSEAAHHLSGNHRVFLWDMPGYGASLSDPGAPVDLTSQMSRFSALLRHWNLDRPQVVAHDIGGAVAMGAHVLHDSDYASLFLWDAVMLEPWGSPFFRLVAEHAAVFAALPTSLHRALVTEYISGAAGPGLTNGWIETLSQPWLDEVGQSAFYRQIASLSPNDTRPVVDRLGQIRCPAKLGWGAVDPWIPVEQASRLQHLLPGQPDSIILAGVGHLAPLENPPAVHRALDDWLTKPAPPGLSRPPS